MPDISLSDAVQGGLSGMSRYAAVLDKTTADVTKGVKSAQDAYTATMDREEKLRDDLVKKGEEPGGGLVPPKLTPPPTPKSTEPAAVWGSAAMWVAALGGLLTRRPLTNALNAAAGVMQAFRDHDSAAAQSAYDTWKTETDNAMTMFKFANDALRDSLSIIDTSEKVAFSNFQVTAKTLGDVAAMQVDNFNAAARLVEARQAHADRMATAGAGMSLKYAQGQLQLGVLNAVNGLQAARQSKDPKKIEAAQQALADAQERLRGFKGVGLATDAKAAKDAPLYDAALKEVDRALDTLHKHPTVAGSPGIGRRVIEGVGGWFGQRGTPAQDFETQITAVQTAVRNLVSKSHYMSAGAIEQIDDLVKGLGVWDNPESTRHSLAQIKDILNEQRGRPAEDDASGGGSGDSTDYSTMSNEELLNALGSSNE